jgi:hypothetical protein
MPPRTNAKKAKARAKAKAKVQAEADENKPSFDVDESVAAAVLEKVTSTRDRLALACVSQVWKNAVTSEGAWGTCDLVLDGELGERLTDERFERLLCYCGDIKHLEVRDAPLSFVGNFLSGEGIAAKFASLESFKLTNCPGVNVSDVAEFMSLIGMEARPEEKRLRCLRLAGCCVCTGNQDAGDFPHEVVQNITDLHECLAIDQQEVFHIPMECSAYGIVFEGIYEQVQFLHLAKLRASFDLWHCDGNEEGSRRCDGFTTTPEMKICENCAEVFCPDCVADSEGTSCDTCDFFVCGECLTIEEAKNLLIFCAGSDCDNVYCKMCYFSGGNEICRGSPGDDPDDQKCFKAYCKDCAAKERINYVHCPECHGCWCTGECVGTLNVCFGKGGCYKSMCIPCMKKKGRFFPFCNGCESSWCPDCDPGVKYVRVATGCEGRCPSCCA